MFCLSSLSLSLSLPLLFLNPPRLAFCAGEFAYAGRLRGVTLARPVPRV